MKKENAVSFMATPTEMAQFAEDVGTYKATKNQFYSFLSAISAGAFIALAF
ncbi:formate transporter FocA, partial [Avibacterium paragallinarum]